MWRGPYLHGNADTDSQYAAVKTFLMQCQVLSYSHRIQNLFSNSNIDTLSSWNTNNRTFQQQQQYLKFTSLLFLLFCQNSFGDVILCKTFPPSSSCHTAQLLGHRKLTYPDVKWRPKPSHATAPGDSLSASTSRYHLLYNPPDMTNIWHSNIPERHPALFEYFQLLTFSKKISLTPPHNFHLIFLSSCQF